MLINNVVHKITRIDGNSKQFVSLVCRELGYIHGYLTEISKLEFAYGASGRLTSKCQKVIHSTPSCSEIGSHRDADAFHYVVCSITKEEVRKIIILEVMSNFDRIISPSWCRQLFRVLVLSAQSSAVFTWKLVCLPSSRSTLWVWSAFTSSLLFLTHHSTWPKVFAFERTSFHILVV